MSASGLFVAGSAVVAGAIGSGMWDIHKENVVIKKKYAARHNKNINNIKIKIPLDNYIAGVSVRAIRHLADEVLMVLPPAYALLYYLGHV